MYQAVDTGSYDGFVGEGGQQFAEAEYLGEPSSGSFQEGAGVSTSQLMNPNVTIEDNQRPKIGTGTAFMQSPGVWVFIVVMLFLFRAVFENLRSEKDPTVAMLTFEQWFLGGLSVATFLYAARTGSQMLQNGGWTGAVKQFFGAV
jgi:hypothetical protein